MDDPPPIADRRSAAPDGACLSLTEDQAMDKDLREICVTFAYELNPMLGGIIIQADLCEDSDAYSETRLCCRHG